MSEDVSEERLSVAEAAVALGVTRDAIHKRINRGTIQHEKGADGRFYVYVDTSTQGLDSSTDTSKDKSKVEALERLIDNQQDRISFLEHELERRGDETERLHQIVAGLTRATAELSARIPQQLEPPSPPETPEPREDPDPTRAEPERAEPSEPVDLRREEPGRVPPERVDPRETPVTAADEQQGRGPVPGTGEPQEPGEWHPWWRRLFGG